MVRNLGMYIVIKRSNQYLLEIFSWISRTHTEIDIRIATKAFELLTLLSWKDGYAAQAIVQNLGNAPTFNKASYS